MDKLFTKTFFRQALWFLIALCLCFVLLLALGQYNKTTVATDVGATVSGALKSLVSAFSK
jgi:hypothetical protein